MSNEDVNRTQDEHEADAAGTPAADSSSMPDVSGPAGQPGLGTPAAPAGASEQAAHANSASGDDDPLVASEGAPGAAGHDVAADADGGEASSHADASADAAGATESDPLSEAMATISRLENEAKQHAADQYNLRQEYNGYVKRSKAQQSEARAAGVTKVIEALLPVLDDIALARLHDDLDGGPTALIAEKVENILTGSFGVERYGEVGDPFDPELHDALTHRTSADVSEESVDMVIQPGYKVDGKVIRAARVGVVSPE